MYCARLLVSVRLDRTKASENLQQRVKMEINMVGPTEVIALLICGLGHAWLSGVNRLYVYLYD